MIGPPSDVDDVIDPAIENELRDDSISGRRIKAKPPRVLQTRTNSRRERLGTSCRSRCSSNVRRPDGVQLASSTLYPPVGDRCNDFVPVLRRVKDIATGSLFHRQAPKEFEVVARGIAPAASNVENVVGTSPNSACVEESVACPRIGRRSGTERGYIVADGSASAAIGLTGVGILLGARVVKHSENLLAVDALR